MQIKKFIKPTLKEAIEQVKTELGEEALVLSTRIIPAKDKTSPVKMFEVVASVEEDHRVKMTSKATQKIKEDVKKGAEDELQKLKEKIFSAKQQANIKSPLTKQSQVDFAELNKKLDSIKLSLLQSEIQPSIANNIIDQLKKQASLIKQTDINNYLQAVISSLIPTSRFEVEKKKNSKLVAMVGPTGVGKTTCIAKLAVISKILHKLDVGLITLDTYRLGALDQLKIFSEVSKIDFLVAYDAADLSKAINKFRKKDIVFIDTAGRSQNNLKMLANTKEILNSVNVDEILLAVSSTGTTQNLLDVAKKFKILNYKGFIFTKLDEAVAFGNILNVISKFNIPVKFLTNGQVIPDDIIAADSDFIAKMILTGKYS